MFVNEFLVVGDYRLGNGLSDSIDLGRVTTTGDADTDIDTGEFVKADDENRFVDLCWSELENPIFNCRRTLLGIFNANSISDWYFEFSFLYIYFDPR